MPKLGEFERVADQVDEDLGDAGWASIGHKGGWSNLDGPAINHLGPTFASALNLGGVRQCENLAVTLYGFAVFTHSYVRWLVLAMAVVVLVRTFLGWRRGRPWTAADDRWHSAFVGIIDLQFTIGLLLYLWLSPVTWAFFTGVGAAMKDPMLRFFGLEHVFGMVAAMTLIHVARGRSRRFATDRLRHRQVWMTTLVALAIIAASIPWPVLPYGRPLLR